MTKEEKKGAAVESAEDDAQPTEFPVDFEEWAGSMPAAYRVLIAGFRSVVRKRGELLRKQKAAAWGEQFTKFQSAKGGE